MSTETTEKKTYTAEEIAANRKVWTDALRSGEYEQGTGQLRTVDSTGSRFCCLGVAECLFNPGSDFTVLGGSYPANYASKGVARALGLVGNGQTAVVASLPQLPGTPPGVPLDILNDDYGLTFAEIADLIDDGQLLVAGEHE